MKGSIKADDNCETTTGIRSSEVRLEGAAGEKRSDSIVLFHDGRLTSDLLLVGNACSYKRIRETLFTVSRRDANETEELREFTKQPVENEPR